MKISFIEKILPVEYGKPLHGWIVFAGDESLYGENISQYRVTCIDAYRKKHKFKTSENEFENIFLLQDLAGVRIPESAKVSTKS